MATADGAAVMELEATVAGGTPAAGDDAGEIAFVGDEELACITSSSEMSSLYLQRHVHNTRQCIRLLSSSSGRAWPTVRGFRPLRHCVTCRAAPRIHQVMLCPDANMVQVGGAVSPMHKDTKLHFM